FLGVDRGQRLVGIGGGAGRESFVAKDIGDEFADVAFVVDDQNIAHVPVASSGFCLRDCVSRTGRRSRGSRISAIAPRWPVGSGAASASISVPPCSSTIFLTMGRPSPVPPCFSVT